MFVPNTRYILDALPDRNRDDYEAVVITNGRPRGEARANNRFIKGTGIPLADAT